MQPAISRRTVAPSTPGHVGYGAPERLVVRFPERARPAGWLGNADDATLAQALLAQDPEARAEVWWRFKPLVARMAARFFDSRADIDDVIQEVFVCLLGRVHTLSHPMALRSFIVSITRFTITYQKKRSQRRRCEPLEERHTDSVVCAPEPEARQTLERILTRVARAGTVGRMAFMLRFIHGLEILEVASVLGRSPATIKRHLARTHRRAIAKVASAES